VSLTQRRTLVFGPAYLDRVVLVDRPLIDPAVGGVIDRSVLGRLDHDGVRQRFGEPLPSTLDPMNLDMRDNDKWPVLLIHSHPEFDIELELPPGWPGPDGTIWNVDWRDYKPRDRVRRVVRPLSWRDELGGMGAGYAKALGGDLTWIAGEEGDRTSGEVARLLDDQGIAHRPLHAPHRFGEWTLLITSGEFGDKLAVGVRNNQDVDVSFEPYRDEPCDLLVAASMTNKRAASALKGKNARVRFFAPARRNMTDVEPRVSQFAKHFDILCCNKGEWEVLADREEIAWRLSILAVTDGPRGAEIRYTTPQGEAGRLEVPAFPRQHPPKDTNRAGEAFASTLVTTLLDGGWTPGTTEDDLIRRATERATAAAALVLDRVDFGFPTSQEIDRAIAAGVV
jgi:sugar/nucleoside kinase (ribokinase family)